MNNLTNKIQPMEVVESNAVNGQYRSMFFDMEAFDVSKVEFESLYFNEQDVEKALLEQKYSFAYLREDKLRTIKVWDRDGAVIKSLHFLEKFQIKIESSNLFKTSKYISRVFRPTQYGNYFNGLNIHINNNPESNGKVTDGISLISLDLAKSLGWEAAEDNASAQFTLFFKKGLVKGHCVVSDKIDSDVVIYGKDNIKQEISFDSELQYVALEPVKLSTSLRIDIQSLINLWGIFQGEQYLEWTYNGIEKYKEDLVNGRLTDWLDNFDEIDKDKLDNEQWILRRAIWKKIDYRKFPGLFRAAWTMFKSSMIRYASDSSGNPNFRIPVPNGIRGYLRVDLRNHDQQGNFTSLLNEDEVEIDNIGNIWFSPDNIDKALSILGGADMDDSLCVVPIEGNRAVIYRNPNQFGEYIIKQVKHSDVPFEFTNQMIGTIPVKELMQAKDQQSNNEPTGNSLLDNFLAKKASSTSTYKEFNNINLLRTFDRISANTSNIGVAANAEMVLSSIRITNAVLHSQLQSQYKWNLERIIDATVKDGTDAAEDLEAIRELYSYIVDKQIPVPKSLKYRMPEKIRDKVCYAEKHSLDELLDAIKYLVNDADVEVLGKGSVSSGKRIPGMIDNLHIPVDLIGLSAINSPMYEVGVSILKDYNRSMAIMLDKASKLPLEDREAARKYGIDQVQTSFLKFLSKFNNEERCELTKVFAYEIYRTEKAVHDSILWISDKEELTGTANDTLSMIANIGIGSHIKSNGAIIRYRKIVHTKVQSTTIRLWSKEKLNAQAFAEEQEVYVAGGVALLGNTELYLGDECCITEGIYKIRQLINSRSRKNNTALNNSLTVYLC